MNSRAGDGGAGVAVVPADHRDPDVAARIHAVQMAAYAQEAGVLGVTDFPPLSRTIDDLRDGPERFLVAMAGGEIIGAIGLEPGEEAGTLHIGSLVVAPSRQREGVGRALVGAAIAEARGIAVTVSTGARNGPAIALYRGFGFVEYRRRVVGSTEPIEVVALRRSRGA